MNAILSTAEEIIDKQTLSELFQGQETELTTGRVLLHAIGAGERALCGAGEPRLVLAGQPWGPDFLPHAPRCRRCVAAAQLGSSPPSPEPGLGGRGPGPDGQEPLPVTEAAAGPLSVTEAAAGVAVRAVHGTGQELAGVTALRDVLSAYDLRRWMFTDLVRVDEQIRGGFSHPLTISPVLLTRRPACALATLVHEQLHWAVEGSAADAAATEARQRWPDPPPPPAGGHDAESSWLHLSVCALEYQSLREILGTGPAAAELRQQTYYSWVYEQILDDPGWFAAFLDRHGLRVPATPPVPRRYIGDEWWKSIPGVVIP